MRFAKKLMSYFGRQSSVSPRQELLNLMDSIERGAIEFNKRLEAQGKVLTSQGIVVVRPDLAYPHIYNVYDHEPIGTRIYPNLVNDMYR